MPTGYTAGVADGTVTTFPEFAMQCARAFVALIEMRDAPRDAPIPDEFKPSEYYAQRIRDGRERVAALEAMSFPQIAAAAEADWRERNDSLAKATRTVAETRERYETMLADVEAWEPPSPEHVEMKKFMADQLRESIRFDCYDPAKYHDPHPLTPVDWHAGELEAARRSLESAVKHEAEERERAEGRTRWVQQLRTSLRQPIAGVLE